MNKIRQPIVTVCGHVDHGKTSLLDAIRGSAVQAKEAGGITQRISFTLFPAEQMRKACPLIEGSGIKLDIPGFLFIDTPGHAAFTNLRKRGGSLADLAVLVIDINEGIKPQTAEVIQILKHNKTPFIVALNKIDNVSGWRTNIGKNLDLKKNIETQPANAKQDFNEKYYTLVGSLSSLGFESDLFYNISDFTKKIALVPLSAKTKEGIPELILVLCGLSQKYLSEKLLIGKEAKGVILEVKKTKSASYAEAILYDGEIAKKDEIAISSFSGEPIITRIRTLEEILPLSEKFAPKEKAQASTGLRLQLAEKSEILSGMPFVSYSGNNEKIKEVFKKEISESINSALEKQGIIAKADSLGSLEALLLLLRQSNIPAVKAGIGNINKADIISAKANLEINELDAIVVGFNVNIEEEASQIKEVRDIKILIDEVIYKLIENLVKFREEKRREIEKRRLMSLVSLCKLKILHQFVFRNTKPAVFGVKIEGGKLISNLSLIDDNGEKIGRVKNMQSENKSIPEALEGMEIAVSIPGVNFSRVLGDKKFLYTDLSESQFRNLKKNKDLLTSSELRILQEIAEIKRKGKADWGI
ncbi:MAG TPA: translation initiation factor IF-2 [Candidatus Nanoarchaeia archaeon]|nr:translation initiation factor IF-2 [Candidatus Nanoarchaeia archaeon]